MSAKSISLEYAKEITVAKVENTPEGTYLETGSQVAEFIEVVYNKIYEIATKED